MKTFFQPKPGASLITMLLLVAVVSIMVLSGIQALTEGGRAGAIAITQEEAKDIAGSGLEEGMLFFVGGGPPKIEGQYGFLVDRTVSTTYSLNPYRQGFLANSFCQNISAAEKINPPISLIDKKCPYQELVIRNRTAYADALELTKYSLSSRDVPNTAEVNLPIRGQGVLLTLGIDPQITSGSYKICEAEMVCTLGSGVLTPGGSFIVSNLLARYFRLSVTYTSQPNPPITVLTASGGLGQVVLGKGYTTIEVTGYSGNVVRRIFMFIRGDGKRYLSEVPFTSDQYGVLHP